MVFAKKKEGLYLRPRVRRTTPLMDVGMAVLAGAVSGVYIFNDTFRRWQQTELELEQAENHPGKPIIPGADQQAPASSQ